MDSYLSEQTSLQKINYKLQKRSKIKDTPAFSFCYGVDCCLFQESYVEYKIDSVLSNNRSDPSEFTNTRSVIIFADHLYNIGSFGNSGEYVGAFKLLRYITKISSYQSTKPKVILERAADLKS